MPRASFALINQPVAIARYRSFFPLSTDLATSPSYIWALSIKDGFPHGVSVFARQQLDKWTDRFALLYIAQQGQDPEAHLGTRVVQHGEERGEDPRIVFAL